MKKAKMLSLILSIVGIMMISIALIVKSDNYLSNINNVSFEQNNIKSVATSTNAIIENRDSNVEVFTIARGQDGSCSCFYYYST